MDLNALGLLPEDDEEDEVSLTCFFMGNVLTTLYVLCMYLCILGNAVLKLIKKENQIFLIYKEIQNGAVAKSYITNGLLIYGEIFAHILIYQEALPHMYEFATAPL
jgi:hypothetical protein